MKNIKVLFLFLALCFSFIISCSEDDDGGEGPGPTDDANFSVKNANPGKGDAVIIGDSIAFGTGTTDAKHNLASCLGRHLNQQVSNMGVPGYSSSDLVADNTTMTVTAKLVFISIGGNDIVRHTFDKNFPVSKTFANVRKTVEHFVKQGVLVVFIGLNPPTDTKDRLAQLSTVVRKAGGLFVKDSMKGLWGNRQSMSDQIHPNDDGYKIVCDRIKKAITLYYP